MIRQKMMLKPYPSKTVLEDVATRSGPPTIDSFTPFIGKATVLREQFNGTQMDNFNIDGFFIENVSFEFDPAKIKIKKEVGGMEIEEMLNMQFLEEFIVDGIESEAVKEWFIQACISYKKRKDSSYRKTDYTYSCASYGDDDDDGTLDPRMIETVKGNYNTTQEEYDLALEKLPFYIKAIWTYSRIYSANLFSFIAAYMDMLKQKRVVMQKNFADYPLYMLKINTGNFYRKFDHSEDLKTKRYTNVLEIFTNKEKHMDVMTLVHNFIDVCDILHINFEKQDTMIFNNEFINKLVCTYLPTNSEYLEYYGEVDAEIMYAVKSNNIYSKTKLDIYKDPNNSIEQNSLAEIVRDYELRLKILYSTYDRFKPSEIRRLFIGTKEQAIKNINKVIEMHFNVRNDITDKLDFSGLLVRTKDDNTPLTLCTDIFGNHLGQGKFNILFTTNGAVIAVTELNDDRIIFLQSDGVIDTLEEIQNGSRRTNRWKDI